MVCQNITKKESYKEFHIQRIKDILNNKKTRQNSYTKKLVNFNKKQIFNSLFEIRYLTYEQLEELEQKLGS